MIGIIESMGIDEMSIRSAKLPGFIVHHFNKGAFTAGYAVSDRIGGIIAGRKHQPVQSCSRVSVSPSLMLQTEDSGSRFASIS